MDYTAIKTTGKVKASVISREDNLLSYTNGDTPLYNGSLIDKEPLQADSVSFGRFDSTPVAEANGFFAEDDDNDLDLPTSGFSTVKGSLINQKEDTLDFTSFKERLKDLRLRFTPRLL